MEGVGITEMQYWPRQAPPPGKNRHQYKGTSNMGRQTAGQGMTADSRTGKDRGQYRTRRDRRQQPAVVEKDTGGREREKETKQ